MSDIAEALAQVSRFSKMLTQAETALRTAQDEERSASEGVSRAEEAERRVSDAAKSLTAYVDEQTKAEKASKDRLAAMVKAYELKSIELEAAHAKRVNELEGEMADTVNTMDAAIAAKQSEFTMVSLSVEAVNKSLADAQTKLKGATDAFAAFAAKLV